MLVNRYYGVGILAAIAHKEAIKYLCEVENKILPMNVFGAIG